MFRKRRRAAAFRDKVADEILKSEREYVKGLRRAVELYLAPMRAASKVLSADQVATIFR